MVNGMPVMILGEMRQLSLDNMAQRMFLMYDIQYFEIYRISIITKLHSSHHTMCYI